VVVLIAGLGAQGQRQSVVDMVGKGSRGLLPAPRRTSQSCAATAAKEVHVQCTNTARCCVYLFIISVHGYGHAEPGRSAAVLVSKVITNCCFTKVLHRHPHTWGGGEGGAANWGGGVFDPGCVHAFLAAALSRVMRAAGPIPAVAAASVLHFAVVDRFVAGDVGTF